MKIESKPTETTQLVHNLACLCVKRAEGQRLTGKKRDAMALDVFLGAGAALESLAVSENVPWLAKASRHVFAIAGLVIATRGFSEVERLANASIVPNNYQKEE